MGRIIKYKIVRQTNAPKARQKSLEVRKINKEANLVEKQKKDANFMIESIFDKNNHYFSNVTI